MDENNNISIWKMMITFDNIWKKNNLFNLKDDDNILHLKYDGKILSIWILKIIFQITQDEWTKLKNE